MLSPDSALKKYSSFQWAFCLFAIVCARTLHSSQAAEHGIHFVSATKDLSITHKFCGQREAQLDVGEPRHASPHDHVPRRRVSGAGEITTEARNFYDVVRDRCLACDSRFRFDQFIQQAYFGWVERAGR